MKVKHKYIKKKQYFENDTISFSSIVNTVVIREYINIDNDLGIFGSLRKLVKMKHSRVEEILNPRMSKKFRIDMYRRESIDKLRSNKLLFRNAYLHKLLMFHEDENISDIQLERIKTDFIIELVKQNKELRDLYTDAEMRAFPKSFLVTKGNK